MSLISHAKEELQRAGLFDKDSDYNGMLGKAVLELIEVFAKQGHSGYSAHLTSELFNKLSRYKPLSKISSNPKEWADMSDMCGRPTYQNRRDGTYFSLDGGKHFYSIDDKYRLRRRWCEFLFKHKFLNRFF